VDGGLLDGLSDAERRQVLASARRRRFRPREVVFHEGDPADCLHMIVSGRFAAQGATPLGDVVTFALLGPDDFFGELALLEGRSARTATVAALDAGETLTLGRADFARLRDAHPGTDRLLVDALAAQVCRTSAALLEALYHRAETRVLRRLVAAAGLWDALRPGGVLPLTQDDLAGLAGTTRPTVNKVMREAEQAGLIATRRGRIEILDPVALEQRAASR
jgi:CRP/FNR family transcriptional regulator, cyclic AMP receptor protein